MAISALTSGDVFPVDGSIGIDFTRVDTAASFNNFGATIQTNKGPAVYGVAGTGGCAAGDYVAMTQSVSTQAATFTKEDTTSSGANPRKGAVAISAVPVGQFGWFLRGPFDRVPANLANSVASGANVTTTGTAGQLGAGGDPVIGLYAIEASGASGLTAVSSVQPIGSNI